MKNKNIMYVIFTIIVLIAVGEIVSIIGEKLPMNFSIESLRIWIESKPFVELLFIILWTLRLVIFIPGVTLMILGGLIFNPAKAVCLSLLGIVISDTLVFLLAKCNMLDKVRIKISDKNPQLIELLKEYNYKILAVGVLCPVAPTDVIVFLSSYIGMSFAKFILIFVGANLPALLLYSCLGESFQGSIFNTIFIILTLIASAIISIKLWNELKNKLNNKDVNSNCYEATV